MADTTTAITIAFLELQLSQMEQMQRDLLEKQQKILEYMRLLQGKLADLRAETEDDAKQ